MSGPSAHQRKVLEIMASGKVLHLIYPNEYGGMTKKLDGANVDASTLGALERNGWIEQRSPNEMVISQAGRHVVGADGPKEGSGMSNDKPAYRWNWRRFKERVQARIDEGELGGGTEEGRRLIATENTALEMSEDYEAALAELRQQIADLRDAADASRANADQYHAEVTRLRPLAKENADLKAQIQALENRP